MLYYATLVTDLTAMIICLWMAFYLLTRGFPSRMTLRGIILLAALGAFFFSAYYTFFTQAPMAVVWRNVFKIIGLCFWHDLTLQLLTKDTRKRRLTWTVGLYILGLVAALSLIIEKPFVIHQNVLYLSGIVMSFSALLFGSFLVLASAGILYNLLAHPRVGFTNEGKYFLFASLFATAGVGYVTLDLALAQPMPRIVQDLLIFSGVFMLGLSVARHSSLVDRRSTLQDFPLTGLAILSFTAFYVLAALRLGISLQFIGPLAAFVVLTHSLYDLVREFLERQRLRHESTFRRQFMRLARKNARDSLRLRLQKGLDLLCSTLDASSGFIGVKEDDSFTVTASRQSSPVDTRFPASTFVCEDFCKITNDLIPDIQFIAPSFDGQIQIAVLGIGSPKTHREYSPRDLELLSEMAEYVGTLVSLSGYVVQNDPATQESGNNEEEADRVASSMLGAMAVSLDQEFIRFVEEGLRQLSDYISLGQSPLVERLDLPGDSHIERGKKLHSVLIEGIKLLRPARERPPEPLPRIWYNHAVLYDAYVEGVANREVMARLYISEGTFNRTRRNAIRGLARLLMEKYSPPGYSVNLQPPDS